MIDGVGISDGILIGYISPLPGSHNTSRHVTERSSSSSLVLKELAKVLVTHDGCQYRGPPEEHQECRPQLHRCPGEQHNSDFSYIRVSTNCVNMWGERNQRSLISTKSNLLELHLKNICSTHSCFCMYSFGVFHILIASEGGENGH